MVEIEAGTELDRAVAEAIGLEVHGSELCLIQAHQWDKLFGRSDTDTVMDMPFMPSTDLNAAFAAGEAEGLFDVHWLGKLRTGWVVHEMDTGPISECQTPSLAICAAILELVKVRES